ncbi:zinc finger protein 358-like [Varroa jacobsoni]|nr:zinc finger protein 358-like [Varroa jacobsoni]
MSSLDALIEVLESLMPEEVKRQIKQSAESEPGYGEVGSQKFSAFTEMDECFKECRDQPRENRLDLLIDALKQQMPPTVKMLIQQEQDRLDEELMECHEELPESSASSSLSSIDDEEVDSELGWSPHDDEDPMLDNSSDVQEALNEERSIEEIDRETPELNNDLEEEAAYSSRGDIPCVLDPSRRCSTASTSSRGTDILDECKKRRGSGARPYRCNVCNCGFGHKSTLRNHYRIHTGERPHRCCVCLKSFSQIGNLKRHLAQHANLALSCPRCGVIFAFGHLLQVHLRSCRKQAQSHERQLNRLPNCKSNSSSGKGTMSATVKMAETHAKDTFLVAAQLSAVDEDSSVAEVTTAWPSEKPGKQVKLWTMYPCPHCDKVLTWQYDLRQHMESHRRLRFFKGAKRNDGGTTRPVSVCTTEKVVNPSTACRTDTRSRSRAGSL